MRRIVAKSNAPAGQRIDVGGGDFRAVTADIAQPISSIKTITMFGDPGGGRTGKFQCGSDSSRVRPILPGKPG